MLKLFIMRHADSHVHGYGGDDFGREISKKGILKTNLVVKELLKQKVYFDIIFTSPSKRTKQTLQILNKALLCCVFRIKSTTIKLILNSLMI